MQIIHQFTKNFKEKIGIINLTFYIKYVIIYIVLMASFGKTQVYRIAFGFNFKLTTKNEGKSHFMNNVKINRHYRVPPFHISISFIALQGRIH